MPDDEEQSQVSSRLLPISMLAEYFYCPRNFYLRYVEGREETDARMELGKTKEEKRKERKRIVRDGKIQEQNIQVASEKLGIIGIIDTLETDGDLIYPVEYKSGQTKDSISDRVQICAQAMALEDMTGIAIPFGFIFYHGSSQRIKVEFTNSLRSTVIEGIKAARNIAKLPTPPEPVADSRCEACSLQGVCLPNEHKAISLEKDHGDEKMAHECQPVNSAPVRPSRPVASISLGNVLYIDENNAFITKKSGRIVISKFEQDEGEKRTRTITEVPIGMLEQVITVGNVSISHPALRHLLRNGIEIVCLSSTGKYEGRFIPSLWKNGSLRLRQVERHLDQNFRLELSRAIVYAKINNSRTLLMRFLRRTNDKKGLYLQQSMDALNGISASIPTCSTIESLLGFEGKAASIYFQGMSEIIKEETGFSFDSRNRRPPKDPVNAMLSFGYTLLMSDCLSACLTVGFDPYVGFLHTPEPGRPALPLDIMEEFRAPIVDSLVITMINKRVIQEDDFETVMENCLMKESGREKFFRNYKNFLKADVIHPTFGYKISRRRCIELQVRLLAKVVTGEIERYIPYRIR